MNQAIVTFDAFGGVEAMHRDDVPLSFLGKMSVSRASEIVFDEDSQQWDIVLVGDSHGDLGIQPHSAATGFHGYDVARRVEVAWLDACRLDDVTPMSEKGIYHLHEARRTV